MNVQIQYRILRTAVLMAGLLATVSGCVLEEDGNEDSPADGSGDYRMTITLVTKSSAVTRAGHTDDGEETGSVAENYIDFEEKDFAIVLYDNEGQYLSGVDVKNGELNKNVAGENVYYSWEGKIVFPEDLPDKVIDDFRNNGFQVLAVANWVSAGKLQAPAYTSLFNKESLASIWKNNSSYNFDYTSGTDAVTWLPNHEVTPKKLIPMFGFARAGKFERRASDGRFISSATIPMQRALAKVEVIDNLANQGLQVNRVTMTQYNTCGRLIPDLSANPQWSSVGSQVDVSSVPDNPGSADNLIFFHKMGRWIAYVPEMDLTGIPLFTDTEILNSDRPHLEVEISGDNESHPVHFAKYNENFQPTLPDNSWEHILRNHIYRFSINKVGIDASIHLHVIPWEADVEEDWEFTDHVTYTSLMWTENTYEKIMTDNEVLLFLEDRSLEGTFRIKTPVNGRWHVRLIPFEGSKPDAVTFVDAEGKVMKPSDGGICLELSGLIEKNDKDIVIRIRPTNLENDQESRFRLEFSVENLGTWIDVPMIDGGGEYTIVRKSNMI